MAGRQKVEMSIDKVAELAGLGLTQRQIADYFGVDPSTLTRRQSEDKDFAQALKHGRARGMANVANAVFDSATKDKNPTAMIWYEKTRSGKSEKIDIRVTAALDQELDKMLDYLAEKLPADVYRIVLDTLASYDAGSTES